MSTKIFDSYRLKVGVDTWALIEHIRTRAEANVTAALRERYIAWCEGDRRPVLVKSPEHIAEADTIVAKLQAGEPAWLELMDHCRKWAHEVDKDKDQANAIRATLQRDPWYVRSDAAKYLTPRDCGDYVRERYRQQLGSYDKNRFNLDMSLSLIEHRGRYYLRTHADPLSLLGDVLAFVPELPELEDYHYQNSSGRPSGVSRQEWSRRRRTWDDIFSGRGHRLTARHVSVVVLSFLDFPQLDPGWDMAVDRLYPPDARAPETVPAGEDLAEVEA